MVNAGSTGDRCPYDSPTEADRYQMIRTYFQMLIEEELPDAVGKMKAVRLVVTARRAGGSGAAQGDL